MNILVKMFKVTLAVLLCEALVAIAHDGDECCHDNQLSLENVKWEIENLK